MNFFLLIVIANWYRIASGTFQCVGTCYSGNNYPRAEDTYKGKYIKGHSYKNITTNDHIKCYRSCIQDCRCKACQIKSDQCELLDADNEFCGEYLSKEEGYVYYNLAQTQYKGKSPMIPHDQCYNGCCRSQPCTNGGRCQELCQNPKQKFFCHCPSPFTGIACHKKISSCLDFLRNSPGTQPQNGKYTIYRSDNGMPLDVYCDFTTANKTFTLIESFALRFNSDYKYKAFHEDFPRNMAALPKWDNYRLSLSAMKYVRTKSTLFRATCEFQNRMGSSLKPDLLLGDLSDYDIINKGEIADCEKYKYINIRNLELYDQTAKTFSRINKNHLHIEPVGVCGFVVPDKVAGEEFFGFYNPVNPTFKCSETDDSTTQWWLGEELLGC